MKKHFDKKTRTMGKLAVMLMTLPCTSALAAYDYSSALSDSTHFSENLVTIDRLAGTGLAAAGTATNANENYIGWSANPSSAVNLYWNSTVLGFTNTDLAPLVVGHALTPSATASASYNKLTVDDIVNLSVTAVTIGQGTLGTGDAATLVDATKPADSNALTITGANYSAGTGTILTTKITASGSVIVGDYGNNNTLEVKAGAQLTTAGTLTIGNADKNNLTSGSGNTVTVNGVVDASAIIGYSGDSAWSTINAKGAIVGNYGGGNTLEVSDEALLNLTGIDSNDALAVGVHSSENVFKASGKATISMTGNTIIGHMPTAKENMVVMEDAELVTGTLLSMNNFVVGGFGSENSLYLTDSKLTTTYLSVGVGDTSGSETDPIDGTPGFDATEGCENYVVATNSHIALRANGRINIGVCGSGNSVTLVGSGIYTAWTDSIPSGATEGDGLVQLDEITTGIDTVSIGNGMNDSTVENVAEFGFGNALVMAESATNTDNLVIGKYGIDNMLILSIGGQMMVNDTIVIGEGDGANSKLGFANGIIATGENAKLESTATLSLGKYGSASGIVVAEGAIAKFTGAVTEFGYGKASTADADNTAYGSENLIGASGEGSRLEIGDGTSDIVVGYYGSGNRLLAYRGATLVVNAANLVLGYDTTSFGNVLNKTHVSSKNNSLEVMRGSSFSASGNVCVGRHGIKNSFVVSGEDSYASVSGSLTVGSGSADDVVPGSGNVLTVTDHSVLVADSVTLGGYQTKGLSSDCLVTVSEEGLLVTEQLMATTRYGERNYIRIMSGMIALKGKGPYGKVLWSDVIFDGVEKVYDLIDYPTTSYVDAGIIKVWDYTNGEYVTATKADLSLNYYSSEAEAKAATGYEGLAGYTILTQANDLSRLAWAGDVYDGGNGSYCSSWYGWFYNNAAYGDYIMSYNNNSWQYVDPSSTPQNTYLYDYSLNAWLYTDETNFQDRGVYNYSTAAWMQLGK